MRLPRVVAGASLIVALALVAVPGPVGSRNPSADLPIDPALLRPVEARAAFSGTAVATPTLDPAYQAEAALDGGDTIVDPAAAPAVPAHDRVPNPAPEAVAVAIATPRPTPTPRPAAAAPAPERVTAAERPAAPASTPRPEPEPEPEPAPVDTSSGGSGWNYDPDVSWYGPGFYGNRTACGQTYSTSIMGVANKTLPCGTAVTFRNPANGATITVPVIDRGPYVAGRNWDLSAAACSALDHCYTGPIEWRFP